MIGVRRKWDSGDQDNRRIEGRIRWLGIRGTWKREGRRRKEGEERGGAGGARQRQRRAGSHLISHSGSQNERGDASGRVIQGEFVDVMMNDAGDSS